jgi:mRNA interferase RelE/StbE
MFEILIERSALKALSKIPLPYRDRITDAIHALADNPRPRGAKELSGRDAWRIRVASYRVIYEIHDAELTILVVSVGDRKDVYG